MESWANKLQFPLFYHSYIIALLLMVTGNSQISSRCQLFFQTSHHVFIICDPLLMFGPSQKEVWPTNDQSTLSHTADGGGGGVTTNKRL